MHSSEERTEPHDERVSTEPQRRALDAMSADLVRKLHAMVAEQEARARDFAEHQHTLSSLPKLQPFLPSNPAPSLQEPAYQQPQPQHSITTPRHRPTIPRRKKDSSPSYAPLPNEHWEDEDLAPQETEQKKESSVGAGTVVFIIFAIIIILRNCG